MLNAAQSMFYARQRQEEMRANIKKRKNTNSKQNTLEKDENFNSNMDDESNLQRPPSFGARSS